MVFNQTVNYSVVNDPLSMIFAALADPTRRSILARLSNNDVTVNELAEPFDMSLPAISKHLKVLEQAGLISTTKDAQYRPKHLEAATMKEAIDWLDRYRQLWEQNLDNLDSYLQQIQSTNQKESK